MLLLQPFPVSKAVTFTVFVEFDLKVVLRADCRTYATAAAVIVLENEIADLFPARHNYKGIIRTTISRNRPGIISIMIWRSRFASASHVAASPITLTITKITPRCIHDVGWT